MRQLVAYRARAQAGGARAPLGLHVGDALRIVCVVHRNLLLEVRLLLPQAAERLLHRANLLCPLDLAPVLGPDVVGDRVQDRLVAVGAGDDAPLLERLASQQRLILNLVVGEAEAGGKCQRLYARLSLNSRAALLLDVVEVVRLLAGQRRQAVSRILRNLVPLVEILVGDLGDEGREDVWARLDAEDGQDQSLGARPVSLGAGLGVWKIDEASG